MPVSATFGGVTAILLAMAAASAQQAELAAPTRRCIDSNASTIEKTVSSLSEATCAAKLLLSLRLAPLKSNP